MRFCIIVTALLVPVVIFSRCNLAGQPDDFLCCNYTHTTGEILKVYPEGMP